MGEVQPPQAVEMEAAAFEDAAGPDWYEREEAVFGLRWENNRNKDACMWFWMIC